MEEREINKGSQFLSFTLRNESFAIEIIKVREVLEVTSLTTIPRMPNYLTGVINLRGSVVPVVDLGFKLGMPPLNKTVNSCILIVEIALEESAESIQMGVLTDSVQEVIYLGADQIEPVPKMGTDLNTEFIKGMGRQQEKFTILLDLDQVLTAEGEEMLGRLVESDVGVLLDTPRLTEELVLAV